MPNANFLLGISLRFLFSTAVACHVVASRVVDQDLSASLGLTTTTSRLAVSWAESQASICLSLRHECLRWVARVVTVGWDVRRVMDGGACRWSGLFGRTSGHHLLMVGM